MDLSEYHKMAEMEAAYWWHQGKKSLIEKQLMPIHRSKGAELNILNIGCGTGGTVPTMSKFGSVTNIDTSPLAIEYCQQRGIDNAILFDGEALPFEDNTFDVAVALDVLEHIEKDDDALKEWRRVLKPEGILIITVPAHQWLWSGHDVSLHHFRRYETKPLHSQLSKHQFNVDKSSYAVAFSFPLVAGYRITERMFGKKQKTSYVKLPKPINNAFASVLDLESSLLTKVNLPLGTSVLAVARKA